MDERLVLRLLHPIRVGKRLPTGHTLVAIQVSHDVLDHRRDTARLHFRPALEVSLTLAPTDGRPRNGYAQTRHVDLKVDAGVELTSDDERTLALLVAAMKRNDRRPLVPRAIHPATEPRAKGPALWVLTGHLGNPLDLTVRTLRQLSVTDTVFVELGGAADTVELFSRYALGEPPRVVEITSDDPEVLVQVDAAFGRGDTVALFGACEGLPSLADPGWIVVGHTRKHHPDVEIRGIGASAALDAALLHLERPTDRFCFAGILGGGGTEHVLAAIRDAPSAKRGALPVYFYADGQTLRESWAALTDTWPKGRGRLTLHLDLSRAGERVIAISPLPGSDTPPVDLDARAKVVVRVDVA